MSFLHHSGAKHKFLHIRTSFMFPSADFTFFFFFFLRLECVSFSRHIFFPVLHSSFLFLRFVFFSNVLFIKIVHLSPASTSPSQASPPPCPPTQLTLHILFSSTSPPPPLPPSYPSTPFTCYFCFPILYFYSLSSPTCLLSSGVPFSLKQC